MDEQRGRARAGASGRTPACRDERELALRFAGSAGFAPRFTGYETTEQATTVGSVSHDAWRSRPDRVDEVGADGGDGGAGADGAGSGTDRDRDGRPRHVLVKLAESPFYAQGGGQVSDVGVIECQSGDCRARVEDVFRLGEDQALAVTLERGTLEVGEPVLAAVDHLARHATECNHTATHLLQAALRSRLGPHVRQAGSYVGPA